MINTTNTYDAQLSELYLDYFQSEACKNFIQKLYSEGIVDKDLVKGDCRPDSELKKKLAFTAPFILGISDKLAQNYEKVPKKRIVFVGQETAGWRYSIKNNYWTDYFENAINSGDKGVLKNGIYDLQSSYEKWFPNIQKIARGSQFHGFMKTVSRRILNTKDKYPHFLWLNLNRIENFAWKKNAQKIEKYQKAITIENEFFKIGDNSLLLNELKILNPDILIFLTGSYHISTKIPGVKPINLDDIELYGLKKGDVQRLVYKNDQLDFEFPLHTYRTYHPQGMVKSELRKRKVYKKIEKLLVDLCK